MITLTGGKFNRRKIDSPKNSKIRPTPSKVRNAVLQIASAYDPNPFDGDVLDLFAGAGTMGFEAVSRGVKNVVFVEKSRSACQLIKKNIQLLQLECNSRVLGFHINSALGKLHREGLEFSMIYMDPPYKEIDLRNHAISLISEFNLLKKEGILMVEHHSKLDAPPLISGTLTVVETRKWGETEVSFYAR
jgi:16S rRNA (guanine966-N2)-methyltransferase